MDIAGDIGEQSDPAFFILDSEYFNFYLPTNKLLLIINIAYKQSLFAQTITVTTKQLPHTKLELVITLF